VSVCVCVCVCLLVCVRVSQCVCVVFACVGLGKWAVEAADWLSAAIDCLVINGNVHKPPELIRGRFPRSPGSPCC
ncbi:unnamed protein product, partial [Arctogadus glacialis]